MAVYADREAFIPYRRTDLIELCIEDGKLDPSEVQKFRDFCEILMAYYHFKLHRTLENLKDDFAPFNPDADTKPRLTPTKAQLRTKQSNLVQEFEGVLQQANYSRLTETALQQAFEEDSLVPLDTSVDFNDFENSLIYYRGDKPVTVTTKQFYIRTVEQTFDMYERVVILLKFKDEDYFVAQGKKIDNFNFTPGKMYLSLYKNIPKFDLELLFPNINVRMTLKDRLLFGVPAVGAAVPVILRVLPSFGLVIGILWLVIFGPSAVTQALNANEENLRNFYPVLTALLTAVIALGGFAFKQYNSYKNKRIKFQKDVTDTLFFRNLENNAGVFHGIIDAAEEEETKEIILVFYHLLTHPEPLTPDELDNRIEEWFEEQFDTQVDFDIGKTIGNLEAIQGRYIDSQTGQPIEATLISRTAEGHCQALPLEEAKMVIDHVWDNLFDYNR